MATPNWIQLISYAYCTYVTACCLYCHNCSSMKNVCCNLFVHAWIWTWFNLSCCMGYQLGSFCYDSSCGIVASFWITCFTVMNLASDAACYSHNYSIYNCDHLNLAVYLCQATGDFWQNSLWLCRLSDFLVVCCFNNTVSHTQFHSILSNPIANMSTTIANGSNITCCSNIQMPLLPYQINDTWQVLHCYSKSVISTMRVPWLVFI